MDDQQTLLCEILTEELPPKAILSLEKSFADNITMALKKSSLSFGDVKTYATPRRLAITISDLSSKQQNKEVERKGPSTEAGHDKEGSPSKALAGFAKSCQVPIDALLKKETENGSYWVYRSTEEGKTTAALLPQIINKALAELPIPKRMRWGSGNIEFIRPVHGVTLMLDESIVPGTILGCQTNNITSGHRFHSLDPIVFTHANEYENALENFGHVIPEFSKRKELFVKQIHKIVEEKLPENSHALINDALLDEVTGLVEWPVAHLGSFQESFLSVPKEALISAMQYHQKCFPTVAENGKLLPHYMLVSNISSENKNKIIEGNNRVMHARLADAAFFYRADCQISLASRIDDLKKVTFQTKLGSLWDKAQRVKSIALTIATTLGLESKNLERAAMLAKTDLMSDMVGEFPELQGIMGYYYALNDGEEKTVAHAITEHYLPRFSGDTLPPSSVGQVLALAERLDTLVGIFAIGKIPTGDKDPFALRRAALGVIRILVEKKISLDLCPLLATAMKQLPKGFTDVSSEVLSFLHDRLRSYALDNHITPDVFAAVFALKLSDMLDIWYRLQAVQTFTQSKEAPFLAAANKRVSNILEKSNAHASIHYDDALLIEPAEIKLAEAIKQCQRTITPLLEKQEYTNVLIKLSTLKPAIDDFFEHVMVMCDDKELKENRIQLLAALRHNFMQVADIALLQS
jgi:glycyl-tRNA synthetase beta chain